MHRLLALTFLLAMPATAGLPGRCPDNGESSSTRSIRPARGAPIAVAKLPTTIRDRATQVWRADFLSRDFPEPASGVHVTLARVFQFPDATFYLVRVNDDQTLLSTQSPSLRCMTSWLPRTATIMANADRPPVARWTDEFYLTTTETPPGTAILIASAIDDEHPNHYDLGEECLLTITEVRP